jgi:hypothetical protein
MPWSLTSRDREHRWPRPWPPKGQGGKKAALSPVVRFAPSMQKGCDRTNETNQTLTVRATVSGFIDSIHSSPPQGGGLARAPPGQGWRCCPAPEGGAWAPAAKWSDRRAPKPAPAEAPGGPIAPARRKAPAREGADRAVPGAGPRRRKAPPLPPAGALPEGAARHAEGEAPKRATAARKGGAALRGQKRAGGAKQT